jgi:pyruvate formate lyase activating enzyme
VRIDAGLCSLCGECVKACPNKALELAGKYFTVESLYREIVKDSAFFRRSHGGVTVGGGEPTLQHQFVAGFLRRCKSQYIHTAIETCGYCPPEHLEQITESCDLVFMDIKHMDDSAHRKLTGVSNRVILENARAVAGKRDLIIRIPVVPGCNDSEENIGATAEFAAGLGEKLVRVDLLPYHKLGTQTYTRLGIPYQLDEVEPPGDEHMERLREIAENCGIKVNIER